MQIGKIESLFIGRLKSVKKDPCELVEVSVDGFVGDRHAGPTKKADVRDRGIPRGTIIRNWRQWSALSAEELWQIALTMGVPNLDAAAFGPNFIVSGITNFTQLPPGTVLLLPEAELIVEAENDPCTKVGKALQACDGAVKPHLFVKAAQKKRGLVGVVKTPGVIRCGDSVRVLLP